MISNDIPYRENPISEHTMAVYAIHHPQYRTKIIDAVKGEILLEEDPLHVLDDACSEYFSSYHGRRQAVLRKLGYTQKVPIAVIPYLDVYAVPTASPSEYECIWIFPAHIKTSIIKENHIVIIFNNGKTLNLPISWYTYNKQLDRVARIKALFEGKANRKPVLTT